MTKETKLSLLVGLAFIITIGILLSDHFRSMNETPQADLTEAGPTARRAVEAPGTGNPPISIVAPTDAPPSQPVPTHEEMARPVSPVVPSNNYAVAQSNGSRPLIDNTNPQPQSQIQPPEDHGADLPPQERRLANLAERNGEPVVPANVDGTPRMANPSAIAPPASGPKQYKAQAGDTVSRMASKFLGSGSQANIQAIIAANPSLQDDPDKVILGQTYIIPEREQATVVDTSPSNPAVIPPTARNAPTGEYFYTVQEGDSLWQIANTELGDPSAVDALKELNASILKGKNHDVVTPGMKLRLPAKPVASAN